MRIAGGILLIVAGIMAYLFFGRYQGHIIPIPSVWYILAIVSVISGIVLIRSSTKISSRKARKSAVMEIEKFKKSADLIKVDLSKCVVRANAYVEETERSVSYRVQALDSLYDPGRNVKRTSIDQLIIMYDAEINGETKKYYSPVIYKDEITTRFQLASKKETYIYVDKEDKDNYYFDLEFLMR